MIWLRDWKKFYKKSSSSNNTFSGQKYHENPGNSTSNILGLGQRLQSCETQTFRWSQCEGNLNFIRVETIVQNIHFRTDSIHTIHTNDIDMDMLPPAKRAKLDIQSSTNLLDCNNFVLLEILEKLQVADLITMAEVNEHLKMLAEDKFRLKHRNFRMASVGRPWWLTKLRQLLYNLKVLHYLSVLKMYLSDHNNSLRSNLGLYLYHEISIHTVWSNRNSHNRSFDWNEE